jgi:acetyl esterase/lipase
MPRGSTSADPILTRNEVTHPLDPHDALVVTGIRASAAAAKGKARSKEARAPFDALMEAVQARSYVTYDEDVIAGVPGVWVRPADSLPNEAILYLHGGWFNLGSANAYRHLVSQIAARAGADTFVPDYRLAPEHPFPAAVDDIVACYRALEARVQRIAICGDSAGGNLALVLTSLVTADGFRRKAKLVGVAAMSPVTDLSLSGETYRTRADADPYFTREQVAALVQSYLGRAAPTDLRASPLFAELRHSPPVRIHVGDDEVLLDDSRRYVQRAAAAGVDARLDVWLGMPHGFVAMVGALNAATLSLDAIGTFFGSKLMDAKLMATRST